MYSSRYQGFAVSQSDIFYDRWTQAEFDELADLGFNLVIIVMRWPYIENEDGTYRTDRIAKYHTAITLATNAGLKVFISFRVSNGKESNGGSDWTETWAGAYPTPDYVNRNEYWGGEYGRTRYVDFLEDMASEFGDRCGFVIWHFPYHMQGASESDAKAYYDETIPACIDALRTHCDDWLVVVPIHQREEYYRSEGYNGYPQLTPYPDTKLLYGAGHFLDAHTTDRHADRAVIEERYGEWDYDTQHMDEEYEWMNSWRQQYNREFFTPEYAGLYWYQSQLGAIPQSRLDAFTYSLELARKLNMSIGYWRISQRHSGSDDMLDESQSFELNHQLRDCMTANL